MATSYLGESMASGFSLSDAIDNASAVKAASALRIFCFTWNTESVRIAETVRRSGEEAVSVISEYWYHCEQADFVPDLLQKALLGDSPHELLVFALQESAKPGDYLLQAIASELGDRYTLLKRQRMFGVGKTSWTALTRDYQLKLRGLRMAVFARRDFHESVALLGDAYIPCPGRDQLTYGKGGIVIVLRVVDIGTIAFLNVHLPFDSKTLGGSNHVRMQTGVAQQNRALNALIEYVQQEFRCIHYMILLGDLNYRVLHRDSGVDARAIYDLMASGERQRTQIYETRDELKQSIQYGAVPPFLEGVSNRGPTFMPTAKMARQRMPSGSTSADAYKMGRDQQRNPSWCDRILFASHLELEQKERPRRLKAEKTRIIEGDGRIECVLYDRFECGRTMTLSDHTSVIGSFTITPLGGEEDSTEGESGRE